MRGLGVWGLLTLSTVAGAQEPDGAVAPAHRWTAPHGPPSGSRRSAARPVLGPLELAFALKMPGRIRHAPITWDGLAYVICEGEKWQLVAIDLHLGEIVARTVVNTDRPPIVWNGNVILNQHSKLVAYRRYKKSFRIVWKSNEGRYRSPIVWDDEIYVINGNHVERLRIGTRAVQWYTRDYDLRGRLAVYGDDVYACGHASDPGYKPHVALYAFSRKNGSVRATAKLGQYSGEASNLPDERALCRITATENYVYVYPPRGIRGHTQAFGITFAERKTGAGTMVLSGGALYAGDLAPSGLKRGILMRVTDKGVGKWQRVDKREIHPIASSAGHPDLMQRKVPAVVIGDVVYFGHWAADIRSREVLWRLPYHNVKLPNTPADGLVLVVEHDGPLRAYRTKGEPE